MSMVPILIFPASLPLNISMQVKKWNYHWNSINCLVHWSEVQTKRLLSDSIEKNMWQLTVNRAWTLDWCLRKHTCRIAEWAIAPDMGTGLTLHLIPSIQALFGTLMHLITCSKWLWIMHPLLTGWEMCSTLSFEPITLSQSTACL